MAKCFDPTTLTYSLPRPPIHVPADHSLSLASFLFKRTSFFSNTLALIDFDSGESLTSTSSRSTSPALLAPSRVSASTKATSF
ncbi:hypothetical protein QN277_016396 [Acacia crassicarpa]|uniref:Uncharacterized protein n=1 Tax=Acacia crassicarpa TaxID=499986 RepID=A0AAE1MWN1_9FABA|nr:hypothetical protein QN277_016396 [Acacia crassicarpa]